MSNTISNMDDVIDSRDIIERLAELTDECENSYLDYDDYMELCALSDLAGECEGCGDWEYGEALVRESYWTDYVQELCEDIGDIPKDLPHYIVIDWDSTARNIATDYMHVDFDGITYYMRIC